MARVEIREKLLDAPLFERLSTPAQRGVVNIFWLGQAGFAFRSHNCLAVIDPYLSNHLAEKYRDAYFKHIRMMPPPLSADELRGVDYLLSTHAHSDHLDPGSIGKIMALNPACRLVCPASARKAALERGADPDRILHPGVCEKARLWGLTLEMLPSAHEELSDDAEGNPLFAGYVLDIDGARLYHSGDCVPFEGLAEMLAERKVDVALLPVNGRDAERSGRGIAGNFTVEEAADLCVSAGIRNLVPHHFGMFDFNTVEPGEIAARLEPYAKKGLRWLVPDAERGMAIARE